MKLLELTAVSNGTDGKTQKVFVVVGPGMYFTPAKENKSTAISAVNGIILVEESIEQIRVLLTNQEGEK